MPSRKKNHAFAIGITHTLPNKKGINDMWGQVQKILVAIKQLLQNRSTTNVKRYSDGLRAPIAASSNLFFG
jgi:hypothetical protein